MFVNQVNKKEEKQKRTIMGLLNKGTTIGDFKTLIEHSAFNQSYMDLLIKRLTSKDKVISITHNRLRDEHAKHIMAVLEIIMSSEYFTSDYLKMLINHTDRHSFDYIYYNQSTILEVFKRMGDFSDTELEIVIMHKNVNATILEKISEICSDNETVKELVMHRLYTDKKFINSYDSFIKIYKNFGKDIFSDSDLIKKVALGNSSMSWNSILALKKMDIELTDDELLKIKNYFICEYDAISSNISNTHIMYLVAKLYPEIQSHMFDKTQNLNFLPNEVKDAFLF